MADEKLTQLPTISSISIDDYLYLIDDPGGTPLSRKALISALVEFIGAQMVPGGRLTLTSGTPVTLSDVATATSIYYTPFIHNRICLWDGTTWHNVSFAEVSLALGTVTSGLPYDVFGYLSAGALALEKLAWTNTTTRATGISLQDGRYCKTGDKTRLYLGTFFTISTSQTTDTVTQRYLWNMYNRCLKNLSKADATSHTYTGAIRQWNNTAADKVEVVIGVLDEYMIFTDKFQMVGATGGSCSLGVNTLASSTMNLVPSAVAGIAFFPANVCSSGLVAGYNYIAMLETGAASLTFEIATINAQWNC